MSGESEEEQVRRQFMSPFVEHRDIHFVHTQVGRGQADVPAYWQHALGFPSPSGSIPILGQSYGQLNVQLEPLEGTAVERVLILVLATVPCVRCFGSFSATP